MDVFSSFFGVRGEAPRGSLHGGKVGGWVGGWVGGLGGVWGGGGPEQEAETVELVAVEPLGTRARQPQQRGQ